MNNTSKTSDYEASSSGELDPVTKALATLESFTSNTKTFPGIHVGGLSTSIPLADRTYQVSLHGTTLGLLELSPRGNPLASHELKLTGAVNRVWAFVCFFEVVACLSDGKALDEAFSFGRKLIELGTKELREVRTEQLTAKVNELVQRTLADGIKNITVDLEAGSNGVPRIS